MGDRVYIYGVIANSIYDSCRTNHPCIHQSRMSSSFFFSFEFQKHDLPFSSQTSSCVLYTNENRVSVTKYQHFLSKRLLLHPRGSQLRFPVIPEERYSIHLSVISCVLDCAQNSFRPFSDVPMYLALGSCNYARNCNLRKEIYES